MFRTAITLATAIAGTTLATAGAVAGHPAERRAYEVSISQQSQDVAVAGDTLTLKGNVRPPAPRQTVRLQVKYRDHKHFKNLDTATLSRNSTYTFHATVDTNRDRVYRVVLPGAPPSTQISERLKVRVYQWVSLSRLGSGPGFTEGFAPIGGASYPDSIIRNSYTGPGQGTFYAALDGRCRRLEAVAGLTDDSPAGSSAELDISPLRLTLTRGPAQPVALDLDGRFSLTIDATNTDGAVAALGSPRALCHDSQGFPG